MLVRWGLILKLYDLVAEKGVDYRVPILDCQSSPVSGYLFGGR